MSVSRSESQAPQYGRKRSNTVQSLYKNAPLPALPLKLGDSKSLTTWVHDSKDSASVILNHAWWPGVAEGDMLQLTPHASTSSSSGVLFTVGKDEAPKHQLQISIPRPIADKFGIKNNGEVLLTKVDKTAWSADYVELTFQDQYLGRNEMWRLDQHLVGQCLYVDQEISFIGVVSAKIHTIYINGKKVSTGYITSKTKTIYRSLSARATIFIQVCRELWEFAGDGERYNEKIVHSFLPALFTRWKEAGTTHIVTIVLISRVFYDSSEVEYAKGPLRCDEEGRWYKDFFKVITDLEVIYDWKPTLVSLKDSFWAFQRDILLAHHYHRASLVSPGGSKTGSSSTSPDPYQDVRLVGRLSYAHDGPILEALNLSFNPMETHYIDRSLSLTGAATIIITPGTGYFRVSKQLLRLTTTRLLDQGFAVDLVSLTKPPLHQSPIFCFQGVEPEVVSKYGSRTLDTLWGGSDIADPMPDREKVKKTFWWEPFWMSVSFWDRQMDLPFREDRFVARAKMHEIEMLGLLDHDVLSSIKLPFLPDLVDPAATPNPTMQNQPGKVTKTQADLFDNQVFAPPQKPLETRPPSLMSRTSIVSQASTVGSWGKASDLKRYKRLSTSPSQSSVRSGRSARSTSAVSAGSTATSTTANDNPSAQAGSGTRQSRSTAPRISTSTTPTAPKAARFTPSWLWSTFTRSGPSQPQMSAISAAGISSPVTPSPLASRPPLSAVAATSASTTAPTQIPKQKRRSPQPMAIGSPSRSRLGGTRNPDEDNFTPTMHKGSLTRQSHSPVNTPPSREREEATFGKRRSMTITSMMSINTLPSSSSPVIRTNPSKPLDTVPSSQSSLARRWQHIFPLPLSKHDIKWKSMITPACLPLSVEYLPSASELESAYDMSFYDFVVDPPEMKSFLVRPPTVASANSEVVRRAWALVVMRGMVAVRLAQGFQFVLRSPTRAGSNMDNKGSLRRTTSYVPEDDATTKLEGSADILKSTNEPLYLSMSNEIHQIAYSGDSVQVRRYVRRMPRTRPFDYQCLIWPKLGVGYTELRTSFVSHGLENYGWNRLDMLVAGYENQFNESLRYWRTRFVVIPTDESPTLTTIGSEKLNDEEIRLLGMDKLAEMFSKVRWVAPDEKGNQYPPVRFLVTDLGPTQCLVDESLVSQLDEIHAAGPLRKKMKSERDISDMSLANIAKAMREEDGVPVKDRRWHRKIYLNAFTGAELVSWLVREFRDVPTREQATEWGAKLQDQGLFDHCRGTHGFLDGHYFYTLRGEYLVPMTPRGGGWFRSSRHVSGEEGSFRGGVPSSIMRTSTMKKPKKKLIMSQSMVIDIDQNKKSDQAETILLHHDIIHNPATCFHFELQWIGTTARCIDDILRQWSRTIERYGLKLVEAYVSQIGDIRDRNPFQSCFPIPLSVPPPVVPNLEQRVPEGTQTTNYFECALLRKMGFVLDIEAGSAYPDTVDVVYSYRRLPFKYSQWVHRSGVAFVQILGGAGGFLFLTNRLMAAGKFGPSSKFQRPSAAADEIRDKLHQFCSDAKKLEAFYNEELAQLEPVMEEPEPFTL
ncbi:hypothetical protein NM688_g932 [Phlebia brevispora]|uniref:Uncharacterized protein n=1 Tax=Phlebia brevispora TaxID=194682 RepID=A0ACC1TCQ1_9APHY|nr:hypothetical protein NM688_g932 [Phlebia brevispora]